MSSKYAPGTQTWGRCQRCSMRFLLRDLVFDGYMPGLRVCVDCYDPRHPQEFLQDTADPQGLWQPSPEFGPKGPVLSVMQGAQDNILNWTAANTEGGARIDSYVLYRAVSYDGGLTFQPFAQIYSVIVPYDLFGANLWLPDHPLDYTPVVPPGVVVVDPYTYTDNAVVPGLTYLYQVFGVYGSRQVNSNVVQASSILVVEYLTSRPYPYDLTETLKTGFAMDDSNYANQIETFKVGWSFTAGSVYTLLLTYSNGLPETFKTGFSFQAGTVVTELLNYTFGLPETFKTGFSFQAGTVVTELINYTNGLPETFKTNFSFIAGTVV